jgi:hypothetical protein
MKKRIRRVKSMANKVTKHLKGDIKTFKHEASEDRDLMKELKAHYDSRPDKMKRKRSKIDKMEQTMHEFKEGELHTSSKKGPIVKSRKQALAIALNESRKARKKRK